MLWVSSYLLRAALNPLVVGCTGESSTALSLRSITTDRPCMQTDSGLWIPMTASQRWNNLDIPIVPPQLTHRTLRSNRRVTFPSSNVCQGLWKCKITQPGQLTSSSSGTRPGRLQTWGFALFKTEVEVKFAILRHGLVQLALPLLLGTTWLLRGLDFNVGFNVTI